VNRFGALPARLREQGVERIWVLNQVLVGHGVLLRETEASPESALRIATPSFLSW
jgi:hypothetical protein